jgi:Mrp family chromosome partitioning ATPase
MPAANLLVAVAGHAQSAAQGRSVDVFSTALRKRFPQMLADLRKRFGYVIVDLPPLLENPGVEAMTGDLDAAVLVVRDGVTEASSAKQAAQLLEQANLIGVVRLAEASQMPGWLDNALGA